MKRTCLRRESERKELETRLGSPVGIHRNRFRNFILSLALTIAPLAALSCNSDSEKQAPPENSLLSRYQEVIRSNREEDAIDEIRKNYCNKGLKTLWANLGNYWIRLPADTATKRITNSEGDIVISNSLSPEPGHILLLSIYANDHGPELNMYHTHPLIAPTHLGGDNVNPIDLVSPSPEDYAISYMSFRLGIANEGIISPLGVTRFGPTDQFKRSLDSLYTPGTIYLGDNFDSIRVDARSRVAYRETRELFRNSVIRPFSATVAKGDFFIEFEPVQ